MAKEAKVMKKAERKRLTLIDIGWYNSYPMKNHRVLTLIKILALIIPIILSSSVSPCFAAFSMTVEPYDGGYDLRFGKIDTQDAKVVEEVTFTITTDIDKQYRVYQRLDKPLTTPDGIEIDKNQFKMYTRINSNTKGTLERIEEFPVMYGDTVLYTSTTAGEGDSFEIVYTLEPSINQVEGSYYGRMIYILRPIDSTQDEVTDTIQMYVDLTNEGTIEVSTDTGYKSIKISSSDLEKEKPQYPTVFISVKGNLGSRYHLYQKLGDTPIKSTTSGELFDLTKVQYEVVDTDSGAVIKEGNLTELKKKSLLYLSDDLGSSDEIAIEYKPAQDFPQHEVGLYRGLIKYYFDIDSTISTIEPGFIDSVDAEFNVDSIFKLTSTSITDEGEPIEHERGLLLYFGEAGYKDGTKESRVKINVESNLSKPYLVTQKFASPLQNEEGYEIPNELFTFELEKDKDTEAKLKFEGDTIVEAKKDIALFVSNDDGDSDEFVIIYKLKPTRNTRGGLYNVKLSYSLSEL